MFGEYFNLSFFLIFSFILSSIIFILSYFLIVRKYDIEKISTYECGFDPFDEDTRGKFDVRFYLVSILFKITNGSLILPSTSVFFGNVIFFACHSINSRAGVTDNAV